MNGRTHIQIPHERLAEFCRKKQITELALFGSVLRDDFKPDSDIDVLVTFSPQAKHSLFDIIDMQDELAEMLGHKVDLVERKSVERSENYIRRKHILESYEVVHVA